MNEIFVTGHAVLEKISAGAVNTLTENQLMALDDLGEILFYEWIDGPKSREVQKAFELYDAAGGRSGRAVCCVVLDATTINALAAASPSADLQKLTLLLRTALYAGKTPILRLMHSY